jgi:hypothetical protein
MRQGLIFDEQRVGIEDARFLQASLFTQDRCQRPKLTGSRCLGSNESPDRRIDVGIDHVPGVMVRQVTHRPSERHSRRTASATQVNRHLFLGCEFVQ